MLARNSHAGRGLRLVPALRSARKGPKSAAALRSRPLTPRAIAATRPEGRCCPVDRVRQTACPMRCIAPPGLPALSTGQHRADRDQHEKCGLVDTARRSPRVRPWAKLAALLAAVAITMSVTPASAQDLLDSMALAHETNPTLSAQREQLRGTNELVSQALSGYRPNVEASGDFGLEYQSTDPSSGSSQQRHRQSGLDRHHAQPASVPWRPYRRQRPQRQFRHPGGPGDLSQHRAAGDAGRRRRLYGCGSRAGRVWNCR